MEGQGQNLEGQDQSSASADQIKFVKQRRLVFLLYSRAQYY